MRLLKALMLGGLNLFIFNILVATPLITMDWDALNESKKMVEENNKYIMPSYERVIMLAERDLTVERITVVDKPILAPSGDKHDYMSFGPYWWPNPESEDGLPYVRRDGETNPDSKKSDNTTMLKFTGAIETLGLAYFFTGEKRYAEKSAELLKGWFIDKDTKMNPHLKYAQAIPGRVEGRPIGIIDSRVLLRVLDGMALIETSGVLSKRELKEIKGWFKEFNKWLLEGEYSYAERNHPNNHGTFYDWQVAGIAIFLGDDRTAMDTVKLSQYTRLASHTGSKGQNFHELERTKPYHYTRFDLEAIIGLAHYSNRYEEIDYWNFTANGSSLKKAVDFLNLYSFNREKWEEDGYLSSKEKNPQFERSYLSLSQAARVYGLGSYRETLYKAWEVNPSSRDILKWPVDFNKN